MFSYAEKSISYVNDGDIFVTDLKISRELISLYGCDNGRSLIMPVKAKFGFFKACKHGEYLGYPRNYHARVTKEEESDVRFLITTLADKSLVDIAILKDSIEAAGIRIDHLHPLRFLMTIFSDEKMKVGIRNIKGKGWGVWGQFTAGLKECLSTETRIGNMKYEYVQDFSKRFKLDVSKIYKIIRECNWDLLLETLIRDIPRNDDQGKYGN